MATVMRISLSKLCVLALTGYCSAIPQTPARARHREFSVHKHGNVNSGILNFVEDMPGTIPSGREDREFSTVANGLMRRERLAASKAQAAAAATAAERKHSLADGAKATKAKAVPPPDGYYPTTGTAETSNEEVVTEAGIPENNETLGSDDNAAAVTEAPTEAAAATEAPTKEVPDDKETVKESWDPESDSTDDVADAANAKAASSTTATEAPTEEVPDDKETVEEIWDPESDSTDDVADAAEAKAASSTTSIEATTDAATTVAAEVTAGTTSVTDKQSGVPVTTRIPQLAAGQCAPASAYVGGADVTVSCLEGQAVGDGHWCTPKCGCGSQAVIFLKGQAPPEGGDGPEWGSKLFCKAGVLYPLGGFSCMPDVFNTIDRNEDGSLSRSEFEQFQLHGGNRTRLDVAEDEAVEILKDAELEAQSIKLSPRAGASAKDPDAVVMVYITATVILFSIAAMVLCYLLHQKMMLIAKAADAEGEAVAAKALLQETNDAVSVISGGNEGDSVARDA